MYISRWNLAKIVSIIPVFIYWINTTFDCSISCWFLISASRWDKIYTRDDTLLWRIINCCSCFPSKCPNLNRSFHKDILFRGSPEHAHFSLNQYQLTTFPSWGSLGLRHSRFRKLHYSTYDLRSRWCTRTKLSAVAQDGQQQPHAIRRDDSESCSKNLTFATACATYSIDLFCFVSSPHRSQSHTSWQTSHWCSLLIHHSWWVLECTVYLLLITTIPQTISSLMVLTMKRLFALAMKKRSHER